ncbi:hypothetical protein [Pseudomonas sp. S11P7]|uniref:hypothetical protein n=1 Tax=Pseudomonas sp. S11P7 TaxID=3029169 RepID=UPI00215B8400|nr:hypothetical protein [Pseudomonas sp. S11P7]MCR8973505.1 hypothetical protein [Pseudomonas sp. S11P7]
MHLLRVGLDEFEQSSRPIPLASPSLVFLGIFAAMLSQRSFISVELSQDTVEGRFRWDLQAIVAGSAFVEGSQLQDNGIDHFSFTGRFSFQVKLADLLIDHLLNLPRLEG